MNSDSKYLELVYRGVESDELDYKAAQDWDEMTRAGRAKFVRHLLAFANTRGGYLVVGVGEDASGYPALRTGLTEKQCASFDPSKVGAFVNSHVEPAIDFTIERPEIDGRRYAIFVIHPFKTMPHVCAKGVEGELQTGVFYIRTPDASSRPAHRATELSDIIRRALRNQREMLGRMLRGILYENRSDVANNQSSFDDAAVSAELYFRRRRPAERETVQLALHIAPDVRPEDAFEKEELSAAISNAGLPRPNGKFFTPELMNSCRPVNRGLRCLPAEKHCMWQLFNNGEFLFFADVPAPAGKINAQDLLIFAAETVAFAGKLYSELIQPDELLTVSLKLSARDKVFLQYENDSSSASSADKASGTICRSAADLASGDSEHAARLCAEVFIPFGISAKSSGKAARFITKYLSAL